MYTTENSSYKLNLTTMQYVKWSPFLQEIANVALKSLILFVVKENNLTASTGTTSKALNSIFKLKTVAAIFPGNNPGKQSFTDERFLF